MDYTGGFVLPLAIGFGTAVVGTGSIVPAAEGTVTVVSGDAGGGGCFTAELVNAGDVKPATDESDGWTNYVIGVILEYMSDLPPTLSFSLSLAVAGDVPLGAGLSSSASLEVAVGRFMEEVFKSSPQSSQLYSSAEAAHAVSVARAVRCQRAENAFCGAPCGIMDQFISSAGVKDSLLLIDCLARTFSPAAFDGEAVALIVANSNVTHSIGGGEYPKRVAQCARATEVVAVGSGVATLRHSTLQNLEAKKTDLDDTTYRRALHVITENARTLATAEALEAGDYATVGQHMSASHSSLDKNFEVSCPELNALQQISLSYPGPGVYGSRMTGGGFGGCVITLVEKGTEDAVMEHIREEYRKVGGVDCRPFASVACGGAVGGRAGGVME